MKPVERLVVSPSTVRGTCTVPPSKSATHRAIIAGYLAQGASVVRRPLISDDTQATIRAASVCGATIEKWEEHGNPMLRIHGGKRKVPDDVVDCANSGTTLRIFTALSGHLPGTTVLSGDSSLRRRPLGPLLKTLGQLGVRCRSTRGNGCAPVVVDGFYHGGTAQIPGDVSSQFVSGILFAAPLASSPTVLEVILPFVSRPYVDLTMATLRQGGVEVTEEGGGTSPVRFTVPAPQALRPTDRTVPGDFSAAAFPLVAGIVTGGSVTVEGLDFSSLQGDARIVDFLSAFGARVHANREKGSITVETGLLRPASIDCGDTPDLFPALAVLAAYVDGESRLIGARQLRLKESDRIAAMAALLRTLGVDCTPTEDGMTVRGGKPLSGGKVDSLGDHRILMAGVVAALGASGPVSITDPGSAAVSYPTFMGDFGRLGADLHIVEGAEAP